ncbi:MAG TPA: hypothetical protein VHE79_13705 [Spirochaetia bacterium]
MSTRDGTLTAYLESLGPAAALLAEDHTVLFANRRFRALKPDGEVLGVRIGQVLGCMYSPLLGGCGETVTCILCSLRRSVEQTLITGEGLRAVPVSYPHQHDMRRTFSLTTQRTGDAVLVLLESRPEIAL